MQRKQPIPKWLLEKPILPEHLKRFWAAFHTLHKRMGDGSIPYADLVAYADEHGLEDDDREEFFLYLDDLADALLVHREEVRRQEEQRRKNAESIRRR